MNAPTTISHPSARLMAQIRRALAPKGLSPDTIDQVATMPGMALAHAERIADDLKILNRLVEHHKDEIPAGGRGEVVASYLLTAMKNDFQKPAVALDAAREAILGLIAENEPLGRTVEPPPFPARSGSGMIRRAIEDALYARHNPSFELPPHAEQFRGITWAEAGAQSIRAAGGTVPTGGSARVIDTAFGSGRAVFGAVGRQGTSDLPIIAVNVASRLLLDHYQASESPLKRISRERSAPDFRDLHAVRLGGSLALDKVLENGEITYGTLEESGESMRLATYAKIVALTRQLLVNDDLNAFDALPRIMGTGAAETEARLLVALLEENSGAGPLMADGNPLFHSSRGNIASTAGAPSIATVSEAVTILRRQTGLAGEAIAVKPFGLVVPPELETAALQVVAELYPAVAEEANPFARRLEVLVEPRLVDDGAWYLAAAPGAPESLTHAYLSGQRGPYIETRMGFEVEGMEMKCRIDFAAGFSDWRGWVRNPGV